MLHLSQINGYHSELKMTLGLNHIIAPTPVEIRVQAQSVANALAIMTSLPREGGDERHIGIDEWVDRVRLTLSDEQLHDVTLVTWGLGIEGLLNAVSNPLADDDFEIFLDELKQIPAETLRDTCLYWLVNSTHRCVYIEVKPFTAISIDTLLAERDTFIRYLHEHITKDAIQNYFESIVDLYFDPPRLKILVLSVLDQLWTQHFKAEWSRNRPEIDRILSAFAQGDTRGMDTFGAMQMITGRDLRPIFRPEEIADFEQIIFIPSKHNGPYIMWFGNETTLKVIFTARMPQATLIAGTHTPDVNVLIQRFKALSDENRLQVLLGILEQGELSTQDLIDQFDLNKSAASRYLGQLLANGFITERRDTDGKTKYYSINADIIDEFLQSIASLLKT